MPASAALSIPVVADQLAGVDLPDPVVLAPTLSSALEKVTDPARPTGSGMEVRPVSPVSG